MYRSTRFRIVAIALAFAISAGTLVLAVPGAAVYVAGRIAPPAGDAFERIAGAREDAVIEVHIVPGRIEVTGVRGARTAEAAVDIPRG